MADLGRNMVIKGSILRKAAALLMGFAAAAALASCGTNPGTAPASGTPSPSYTVSVTAAPAATEAPVETPETTPAATPAATPAYPKKDSYMIGEIAPVGGTLVQITDAKKSKGDKYEKPESGNEFVTVTAAIKNAGKSETDYSIYDFGITGSEGGAAQHRLLFSNADTDLGSGRLLPGGTVSGTLTFERKAGDTGMLAYAPSGNGKENAKFDIQDSLKDFIILKQDEVPITGDTYLSGETAYLGGTAVTVENYACSEGVYNKPRAGYEYITVKVKIENTDTRSLTLSPYYFSMTNSFGQVSDPSITSVDISTSLSSVTLEPGGEAEGTIVFEEPAGDSGLALIYDGAGQFKNEKLIFPIVDR